MIGLLILPAGLLAGAAAWWLLCTVVNWIETGRFRAVRRG